MKDQGDRGRLRRVAAGNTRALAELYERHAGLLALRLRQAGASIEETEDILQETFLDIWRAAANYRAESAVAGWIWGVARNKLRMLIRSEIRLRDRQFRALLTSSPYPGAPEDSVVDGIEINRVSAELTPDLRAAFLAVVVDGLTTEEAADRLGIAEGTVKSRVHRARQKMRKELQ